MDSIRLLTLFTVPCTVVASDMLAQNNVDKKNVDCLYVKTQKRNEKIIEVNYDSRGHLVFCDHK